MRINTNVASLTALESNNETNKKLNLSLSKLSSGLAINKASDDASGLAIADKLRTQASSLGQAIKNGNSGVALLQIADKAMDEQSNILDIVKQKLIQAATSTTSSSGAEAIRKDITKLMLQIDNIAKQTNYNGSALLQESLGVTDSGTTATLTFQMGERSADDITAAGGVQANASGLTLDTLRDLAADGLDMTTADDTLVAIDAALDQLNTWR